MQTYQYKSFLVFLELIKKQKDEPSEIVISFKMEQTEEVKLATEKLVESGLTFKYSYVMDKLTVYIGW